MQYQTDGQNTTAVTICHTLILDFREDWWPFNTFFNVVSQMEIIWEYNLLSNALWEQWSGRLKLKSSGWLKIYDTKRKFVLVLQPNRNSIYI